MATTLGAARGAAGGSDDAEASAGDDVLVEIKVMQQAHIAEVRAMMGRLNERIESLEDSQVQGGPSPPPPCAAPPDAVVTDDALSVSSTADGESYHAQLAACIGDVDTSLAFNHDANFLSDPWY